MTLSPEQDIHRFLIRKNISLALAESCTGGALTLRFSKQPGASRYLRGAIIAYDETCKKEILKVPEELLKRYGPVSAPCAEAMAFGVSACCRADLAFSVTGILGPSGGTPSIPVGTVWTAVVYARRVISLQRYLLREADREIMMKKTVDSLLADFSKKKDTL